MKQLLSRALTTADLHPAYLTYPPTISMEEELDAVSTAGEQKASLDFTLADAEHLLDVRSSLEDLAFVTAQLSKPTTTEAALVQIASDAVVAPLNIPGNAITPALEDNESGSTTANNIRAFVEKVIAAIMEAAKFVFEKIKAYLTNIGKTLGNARARYDVAYRNYSEMEANAHGGKVNIRRVAIDHTTMDSPAQFILTTKAYVQTLSSFCVEMNDFENRYRDTMGQFYMAVLKEEVQADKQLKAIRPLMDLARHSARTCPHAGVEDEVKTVNDDKAGFHVRTMYSNTLMGGLVIKRGVCQEIGDFKDEFAMVPKVISVLAKDARFNVESASHNEAETHPYMNIDALDKNGCKQVLDLADSLLKSLSGRGGDSIGALIANLAKKADGAIKNFSREIKTYEGANINKKAYAHALEDVTTHLLHQSTTPLTTLLTNTLRNFNLCLDYVNHSTAAAKKAV